MRVLVFSVLMLALYAVPAVFAIDISGPQNGTLPAGEYLVVGDLTIVEGTTWTIEPGTTFLFDGDYDFTIGPNRTLFCQGTVTDSIRFMPNVDGGVTSWGHIEFAESADDDLLDYCLVTGGSAEYGGGVLCSYSSPTISHCSIRDNSADWGGGGIYCDNADATISGCTISGGVARFGGGIGCSFSNSTINHCTIVGNSALEQNGDGGSGGGIGCSNSNTGISECVIVDNQSTENGGGISISHSDPEISNCTISGNETYSGGGIDCSTSSYPVINHCRVSGNTAEQGGGIRISYSDTEISNCTVSGNTAGTGGGIYATYYSTLVINRCTISGNSAQHNSGGVQCNNSDPTIVNTVIADNTGIGVYAGGLCGPDISYCDVFFNSGGNFAGAGIDPNCGVPVTTNANGDSCDVWFNISLNPLCVDPFNGNFQLTGDSPCIDAGDPDSPLDPDDTVADIGAFPYFQTAVGEGSGPGTTPPLPEAFILAPVYPNPFNATATVEIKLPAPGSLRVMVYDLRGREVVRLTDRSFAAGRHEFELTGSRLASGVYFVHASVPGRLDQVRKITLLK